MILLLSVLCLFVMTPFRSYAAATPSDAQTVDSVLSDTIIELMEGLDFDDLDDEEKLDLFALYLSSLSGPGIASSSDAQLSTIGSDVSAIRSVIAPVSAVDSDEDEDTEITYASDVSQISLMSYASVLDDLDIDRNVVIYKGYWNGSSCYLVIPQSLESSIWISDDGLIFNVGESSITGRIFYDSFDYADYDVTQYYLTPIYSAQSTVYSYGYPNYAREYYEASNRLTYTTTYGNFTVSETIHTNSDDADYLIYYMLLILSMIGGASLLCLFKKSRS